MLVKLQEKEKAISLRKRGYSLKEISKKLGISKSTASIWARNIEITPKGLERLQKIYQKGTFVGLATIKSRWKVLKETHKKEADDKASSILSSLIFNTDHCKFLCALIFWCEGGKRGHVDVRFINSDPLLIQTFLFLLRKGFTIKEEKLRAIVHIHEYHDDMEQKQFWSRITGIPLNQFYKSYIKPRTADRIRENYPGCISIHYADGGKTLGQLKSLYQIFPRYLV